MCLYVHGERPTPAGFELAELERVGEPGRSPPPRQTFRITDRCEDLLHSGGDFTRLTECRHSLLLAHLRVIGE